MQGKYLIHGRIIDVVETGYKLDDGSNLYKYNWHGVEKLITEPDLKLSGWERVTRPADPEYDPVPGDRPEKYGYIVLGVISVIIIAITIAALSTRLS